MRSFLFISPVCSLSPSRAPSLLLNFLSSTMISYTGFPGTERDEYSISLAFWTHQSFVDAILFMHLMKKTYNKYARPYNAARLVSAEMNMQWTWLFWKGSTWIFIIKQLLNVTWLCLGRALRGYFIDLSEFPLSLPGVSGVAPRSFLFGPLALPVPSSATLSSWIMLSYKYCKAGPHDNWVQFGKYDQDVYISCN